MVAIKSSQLLFFYFARGELPSALQSNWWQYTVLRIGDPTFFSLCRIGCFVLVQFRLCIKWCQLVHMQWEWDLDQQPSSLQL